MALKSLFISGKEAVVSTKKSSINLVQNIIFGKGFSM